MFSKIYVTSQNSMHVVYKFVNDSDHICDSYFQSLENEKIDKTHEIIH